MSATPFLLALLSSFVLASAARPQGAEPGEPPGGGPPPADSARSPGPERLRIYLDCARGCDFDFLRTEVRFVDYVRDRKDADVHVMVTTRQTGAGGTEFTLRFLGQQRFAGAEEELRHVSLPIESRDEVRSGMAQALKAGLVRYALRTPAGRHIRIAYGPPGGGEPAAGAASRDPWNQWVFRTRVGGFLNGEASFASRSLDASFSAGRTTEESKTSLSVRTEYRHGEFRLRPGETVKNEQRDHRANALLVRSLGSHWSAGARGSASHSTFSNRDLALRLAPALEYSVFPYAQSTRRELTLQYSLGVTGVQYLEETIFGKTEETLLGGALAANYDVKQRWGGVRSTLEGFHYLHDPSKYRLDASGNLEFRLVRGVSVNLFGRAESIHDQIHLPRGELSPEQVLLRQKQQATSFRYYGSVGLGYSFGSIFNSVVNPRLSGG